MLSLALAGDVQNVVFLIDLFIANIIVIIIISTGRVPVVPPIVATTYCLLSSVRAFTKNVCSFIRSDARINIFA